MGEGTGAWEVVGGSVDTVGREPTPGSTSWTNRRGMVGVGTTVLGG